MEQPSRRAENSRELRLIMNDVRVKSKNIALAVGVFSLLFASLVQADKKGNSDETLVKGQHAQIGGAPEKITQHSQHPDAQWFPDAGLGLFLHWGISSVEAMNISWPMIPGRPLGKVRIEDSEERERIIRERDFNLDGGSPDILPLEYWKMAKEFNPDNYHPEIWLQKAKDAGFTYVVLTTKHHEGFALWPSEYGDFNTKNYMGGKDLLRSYVDACRKVGLKVGFYYSGPDWYFDQEHMNFLYHGASRKNPEFPPLGPDLQWRTETTSAKELKVHDAEYARIVRGQVEELLTNYGKIDIIWFDGKPSIPNGNKVITQERIRELQPSILINGRMHGTGDFLTHERHLPESRPKTIQWAEFCNPWNGAWPYVDRAYRAPGYVLMELVKCRAWGINYLLGIGPMSNGDLAPRAYENMTILEEWTARNKEAIYDVQPLSHGEDATVLASAKGNQRFLYLTREFNKNGSRIGTSESDMRPVENAIVSLSGISAPVEVIYMPTGQPLEYQFSDGQLTVQITMKERSKLVDVIRITLSQ